MQNHFELFRLPQQFAMDSTLLDKAYREVQNQVHPDKFVSGSDAEKRVAMQWATRANEAYQTLRKPLLRAAYLCQLHGIDLQTESNTAMPMAFLMQQMAWREVLDAVRSGRDSDALQQLENELNSAWSSEIAMIAMQFDQADVDAAAQGVRRLMFLDKLKQEIAQLYEHLDN